VACQRKAIHSYQSSGTKASGHWENNILDTKNQQFFLRLGVKLLAACPNYATQYLNLSSKACVDVYKHQQCGINMFSYKDLVITLGIWIKQ